jgi:hypothetical protein
MSLRSTPSALLSPSEAEERKASTTRLDNVARLSKEEVAPCISTPNKHDLFDPCRGQSRGDMLIELSQEAQTSSSNKAMKRRYISCQSATKRFCGVRTSAHELIKQKSVEAWYFRCYYDHDIVNDQVASDAQLSDHFYDDDCETDEEQIEQATALVSQQLQEAVEEATSSVMTRLV